MAYNNEIIKIPASHIRQGYTNDIVVSNFIKQVTGDINTTTFGNQRIFYTTLEIYTENEVTNETDGTSDITYTYNIINNDYIPVKLDNNTYYDEIYSSLDIDRKYIYYQINVEVDLTLFKNILFNLSYNEASESADTNKNVNYENQTIPEEYVDSDKLSLTNNNFLVLENDDMGLIIGRFESIEKFEHFFFFRVDDSDPITHFRNYTDIPSSIFICGIIPKDRELLLCILLYRGRYFDSLINPRYVSPALSYSFSFTMDVIETEAITQSYGEEESSYSYTLETNELFQNVTTLNSEPIFEAMASDIINNRKNGLATAEISTAILKYSDVNGNLIIDPEISNKEHLIKQGMFVQPWINETTPLAYTNTNDPMVFYVNSADFDFNGVGKQNLKLIEARNLSYVNVTIIYGEGVESVKIGDTEIKNGDVLRILSGTYIYIRVEYVEDELDNVYYQPNTGQGAHRIISDTVINVTAIKSTRIYEATISNIQTLYGCSISSVTSGGFEITPTSNDWYSFSTAAYDFDDNKSYEIVIEGLRPLVDYTTIDGSISVVADSTSFGGIRELSDITFESNNPVNWSLQFYGDSEYDFNMISFTCPPNAIAFTRMYIIEQSVT